MLGEGRLAVRTWEFGVEGETLGLRDGLGGLRRSSPPAGLAGLASSPVTTSPCWCRTSSGDWLRVFVDIEDDGRITDLCLDTVVRPAFKGVLSDMLAGEAMGTAAAGQ